jgi:hypothetical protein
MSRVLFINGRVVDHRTGEEGSRHDTHHKWYPKDTNPKTEDTNKEMYDKLTQPPRFIGEQCFEKMFHCGDIL